MNEEKFAQIHLNENERLQAGNVEFTCGSFIEALIVKDGVPTWIQSTVESDDRGYYIVGAGEYSPVGLFAKVKRKP